MRHWPIIFLLATLFATAAFAARLHPESHYRDQWCAAAGGTTEHRLWDATRVDCLTATHAVELDHADKWAEGVGQALHYALMTDRAPMLVLIVEDRRQCHHVDRVRNLREWVVVHVIGRGFVTLAVETMGERCP